MGTVSVISSNICNNVLIVFGINFRHGEIVLFAFFESGISICTVCVLFINAVCNMASHVGSYKEGLTGAVKGYIGNACSREAATNAVKFSICRFFIDSASGKDYSSRLFHIGCKCLIEISGVATVVSSPDSAFTKLGISIKHRSKAFSVIITYTQRINCTVGTKIQRINSVTVFRSEAKSVEVTVSSFYFICRYCRKGISAVF